MKRAEIYRIVLLTGAVLTVGCENTKPVEPTVTPSLAPSSTRTPILIEPTINPTVTATRTLIPKPTEARTSTPQPIINLPTVRPQDIVTMTVTAARNTWVGNPNPYTYLPITSPETMLHQANVGDMIFHIGSDSFKVENAGFVIRPGVGLLTSDYQTFGKAMPSASRQTQYHILTTYFWPLDDSIHRNYYINEDRMSIQSNTESIPAHVLSSWGTNLKTDRFHKIDGFSVNQSGRLGIAIAGNELYLWEAYENAHHKGPITDPVTKDILSKCSKILLVAWGSGIVRDDGIVAVLNANQSVTIYRVSPMALEYKELFTYHEQSQMSGTIHDLNYKMMEMNQKNPKRTWTHYLTLQSKEQFDLLFRTDYYLVGK